MNTQDLTTFSPEIPPHLTSCAICKYIKMCGTCILEYVWLMLYTINFSTDHSKLTSSRGGRYTGISS